VEHHKADVRPTTGRGTSGDDDTEQFLHELRQLRHDAGLGHAELAARAHYPYDSIKAAEVGPSLPDLPVLSAFVRGCGGPTQEWEERWRSLTRSPSLPVDATRQTGRSDAADAGARISSSAPSGDGPDPSVIMAALGRVAEEMAGPGDEPVPAAPVAQPAPAPPAPAYPPDFASPGPLPGGKAASWDPIRVSSAWPTLQHTPTVAEPAGNAGLPGGAVRPDGGGAPWSAAPWAADPVGNRAATSSGAAASTAAGTAFTQATGATSARVAGAAAASRRTPRRSTWIAIVAFAVVLLCAVIALLVTLG